MTREEARKAAEVMLAYADGKEIEFKDKDVGDNRFSRVLGAPEFAWNDYDYRIKPEPKYRPFKDAEECWQEMQKHQPFGWARMNGSGARRYITILNDNDCFDTMFDKLAFADGEPFGIKEEE